jgi:hypothetical protein
MKKILFVCLMIGLAYSGGKFVAGGNSDKIETPYFD